jgi:two-component system, OmpR family, response regulator
MKTSSLLIVCPFPEHHAIIERSLDPVHWRIHHAASCREAAAFLAGHHPAAIICEQHLPDGDWQDILRALRELRCNSALIVSSRVADDQLWAHVLNVGGFDVIGQPFDAVELTRVVESASRSQRQAAAS